MLPTWPRSQVALHSDPALVTAVQLTWSVPTRWPRNTSAPETSKVSFATVAPPSPVASVTKVSPLADRVEGVVFATAAGRTPVAAAGARAPTAISPPAAAAPVPAHRSKTS